MKDVFYAAYLAEQMLYIKISKQKLKEPTWNRKSILIFELFAKLHMQMLITEAELLQCISVTKYVFNVPLCGLCLRI